MVEGSDVEQRAVFSEFEIWNTSANTYVDT